MYEYVFVIVCFLCVCVCADVQYVEMMTFSQLSSLTYIIHSVLEERERERESI